MPLPTPTDEDVDYVREVTGENSSSLIALLIDSLNDAEWARALELVTAWQDFPAGSVLTLVNGGRQGVNDSDELAREDIRRRMRLLLGLPELRGDMILGGPASAAVANRWCY